MKKQHIVRTIYSDGSKENEIFVSKSKAKRRRNTMNRGGYSAVVKYRRVKD